MHAHAHVHTHVHMGTHITHSHVCICAHLYTWACACMQLGVHVHTLVFTLHCMCASTDTHAHTRTHTHACAHAHMAGIPHRAPCLLDGCPRPVHPDPLCYQLKSPPVGGGLMTEPPTGSTGAPQRRCPEVTGDPGQAGAGGQSVKHRPLIVPIANPTAPRSETRPRSVHTRNSPPLARDTLTSRAP